MNQLSNEKVAEISQLLTSSESPPQRCRSAPFCRVVSMRANEEHIMTQRIALHKPTNLVDESALPAPTKFKKEKNCNASVWKIGRSYSAPQLNCCSEGPKQKIEITENIFIKAVILVRNLTMDKYL